MGFQNPIVAGLALIRDAIRSPNYAPGSAGWSVNKDGSAEFNNLLARATIILGDPNGQRIVLDSVNDLIQIYDANNKLRVQMGGTESDRMRLFTGDASEVLGADFGAAVLGAGTARRLSNFIDSPQFAGQSFPTLLLASQSFDGTVTTLMQYVAARHQFIASGDGPTDITLAGVSLPRGIMAAPKSTNAASTAAAVETKDTNLGDYAFTAIAGRRYKVMCEGRLGLTVAGQADLRIRDGGAVSPTTASPQVAGASAQVPNTTGGQNVTVADPQTFTAGVHTIAAFYIQTAGGGNCTFSQAGGTNRKLWVEDIGAL